MRAVAQVLKNGLVAGYVKDMRCVAFLSSKGVETTGVRTSWQVVEIAQLVEQLLLGNGFQVQFLISSHTENGKTYSSVK